MKPVVRYRNFLGLRQKDMAEILNISKQSYWKKENGKTPFTDEEKALIKSLLIEYFPGITIDDIFFTQKVLKSTTLEVC